MQNFPDYRLKLWPQHWQHGVNQWTTGEAQYYIIEYDFFQTSPFLRDDLCLPRGLCPIG